MRKARIPIFVLPFGSPVVECGRNGDLISMRSNAQYPARRPSVLLAFCRSELLSKRRPAVGAGGEAPDATSRGRLVHGRRGPSLDGGGHVEPGVPGRGVWKKST